MIPRVAAAVLLTAVACVCAWAEPAPTVTLKQEADRVVITAGDQPLAVYVHGDPALPRPYFCLVNTLGGVQVTRNHPPDPVLNKDNDDHPDFHPGVWLAFGDAAGCDFWRNKARVRHAGFIGSLEEGAGRARFAVENRYEGPDGPLFTETCVYSIILGGGGWFLICDSTFTAEKEFSFGDQEEMGLGLRLNTPLTVKFGGGRIVNSDGGENEKGTWGRQALWCAADGNGGKDRAGAAIMPFPSNFRKSWFHSRDYGLLVANPFGKKAMTAPDDKSVPADTTPVAGATAFRLGFGLFVYDGAPDLEKAYGSFLKTTGTQP